MEEVGFPGQHSTTTTVTSRTTVEPNMRFDPLYVQTVPGLLKVAQVLLSLFGFISVQCSGYENHKAFFSFVAMVAFWFTGILLGLYLFHLVEKFYKVPWLRIECGFCVAWTFFYLLASSLVVSVSYASSAYSAAAFFGYACMFAYAADAFLKYRAARSGGLAQGTRVVSKQVTSQVTSPEREREREGY